MQRHFQVSMATMLLVCFCVTSLATDDWPQFRGPDGQGHSSSTKLPVEFGPEKAVKWRTPIDGKGWSSPVVQDGRIWLTTAITVPASEQEQRRKLAGDPMAGIKEVAAAIEIKAVCIEFNSGRVLHDLSLKRFDDPQPINPLNTYASPTPVIEDNRVYCDFGNYGTWCIDSYTGDTIWHKQTIVDYSVGPGSSPILCDDKLILVCDGTDEQFVLALDKETGEERWRASRPAKRADDGEFRKAYSTPLVINVQGQRQIVVPSAQWICGYDPDSGQEIWRFDHGSGFSVSPRPIYVAGLIVFSTGYMRPELVAVRPDGTGDVTATHQVWRVNRGAPTKPSPIAVGEQIYMVSDTGILSKLDARDGSILWQERLAGNYSASPVQAGNKLYFPSHEGTVTVVGIADDYQELARNQLEPRLMASPAVVGEDLLIRSEFALYRIGL